MGGFRIPWYLISTALKLFTRSLLNLALCLAVYGVACFSFSVLVKNSTKFTYTANQSKGALSHDWQGLGGFWVLDLVKVSKGKSP